ncbi:MAG: tetratricopeptide repeat protein, partial [Desulfobulbaceae bacterium]|nr:tetratricopeptide repeat protein [Desulfobulbaceae bacterium]
MKKFSKHVNKNSRLSRRITDIPKLLQSAVSLHQEGRLPEAKSLYQQILQCNPRHPVALHFMGMIAFQTGDHKLAVDLTSKSIQADPQNALYFFNRGIIFHAQDNLEATIDSYRRAIALSPNYAEAHFNLGLTLFELSNRNHNTALLG